MGIFRRRFRTVNVRQAKELIEQGHLLIDVRSEKEWRTGHVDGARHLPLDAIPARLGELPAGTPVVTMCHSGIRSAIAARKLAEHGYSVSSVRGGMIAWNHAR
jgi:rhodanese-related sulfurtransferase